VNCRLFVALRFFFTTTLGLGNLGQQVTRVDYPRRLPRVLSPEAAPGPGLKYKAAFSVAYGAGLRATEVVLLKVSDIDSQRMLIRVEQGKGRQDRHTTDSPASSYGALGHLRRWGPSLLTP
jgi:integrase/recombinase XerD